ncbi:hypothetical protein BUALT_Bualt05G0145100 [Buddleja alternifolia]|uniref:Uncharacterized protein n=1 Tax=Buddleja alternifolia TaxID=168488 RepID=A0AAV6XSK3_9LAMI|nr:hypothetical protein BUALT_Bualt05G0145100 [Buddleja alternifolia]
MGTKVHYKSYLPGYCSMRDLNEDSSSSSWPLFYRAKPVINGQYCNGFMPGTLIDSYPGHEKDALKQKMLEHEAVFKNQVCELHRLYKIQRDMMEDVKRKEHHKHRTSLEPSSSSSLQGSQVPSEDARKWHMAGFPLLNSSYSKTGVEIVNSPMSCTKTYNNTQRGQFPFNSGSTSKNFEESRPSKVRKKLFDLQLPADEYLDTEDEEKLRGNIRLTDLNEPIQVEEVIAPSPVDFLGRPSVNGESKGINQPVRSNAGYLGVIRETNGFSIKSSIESKVNERGWLSRIYEEGSSKNHLTSVSQGREPDKFPIPSYPVQAMLNQVHHPNGIYPTGYSTEDHWRDGPHHGLESSDRTHDPFFSSNFSSSWAKPANSFAQKLTTYGSSSNAAAATSTSLLFGGKWQANGDSRLYPGLQSELTSVNGFHHGSSSGSKELHVPGFDYLNSSRGENVNSDRSTNRGFFENFQKGSCRADTRPAIDINLNEVVSKSLSNEMQDLNMVDGKSTHEGNLSALPWLKTKPVHGNEASSLCCKNGTVRDLNQLYIPKVTLASSDCEVLRKKEISEIQDVKKILGIPIVVQENEPPSSVVSTSANLECQPERKNVSNERKNRIIDINLACEPDEEIAAEEPTLENEKREKTGFIRDHIDLNSCFSECEDPPPPSNESKGASVKTILEIDLEVSVFSENEDDNTPPNENMPDAVPLKSLEHKNDQIRDEVLRNAAETMVSISSYCPKIPIDDRVCHPEASLAKSLLWFVDACVNELESPSGKESRPGGSREENFSEEIDDFEAMTLQLAETKEEDYMPKPFCPEFPRAEDEVGPNALNTRPRRGQARRGRQRRDFQRDILPGLASLSRHEVTEDIQTFGELMRATGHSWNSGLTRRNGTRNGSGRGRRRAVVETGLTVIPSLICTPLSQQHTNIEVGLEDRSLTGWGKTTRRPRRQRCHAGNINPPTIVLT